MIEKLIKLYKLLAFMFECIFRGIIIVAGIALYIFAIIIAWIPYSPDLLVNPPIRNNLSLFR